MTKPVLITAAAAAAALAACALATACAPAGRQAPLDTGVCYAAVEQPDKKLKFNKVAEKVQNLEFCAAALEKMRIEFLRMGGNQKAVVGAYQGHFIFLERDGIYSGETYDGPRFMALVRYNGKLVMPSAVPQ